MKRLAFLSLFLLLVASVAGGQELKTGYFLDNYVYSYRLNPSSMPTDSTRIFFGLLINDITVGGASNVAASNVLFPIDGTLYNGFNQKVSSEQFLGSLPEMCKAEEAVNLNLLTVGTKTRRGFLVIEANVKSNSYVTVPKGYAAFLKNGGNNVSYTMNDTKMYSREHFELTGTYSLPVGDNLSIGATAKLLVGLGYADVDMTSFSAKICDTDVVSSGKGNISVALPGLNIPVGNNGCYDLGNVDYNNTKIAGFGGAIDLGVTWAPVDGLTVNAALLDLGAIAWKTNVSGDMDSNEVSTPVYDQETGKTLLDMIGFKPNGQARKTEMISPTLNIGARYVMPFYDKLSAGLHGSFSFGNNTKSDVRIGVTFTPSHVLSLALSGGATNYGAVLGGAINLRFVCFDMFAGIDSFIWSVTPQMIPMNKFNTLAKAGITIAIQ